MSAEPVGPEGVAPDAAPPEERCWHCEEDFSFAPDAVQEVCGRTVCDECLEKFYSRCHGCRDYHETDFTYNGRNYCESCASADFTLCDDCNEMVPNDDISNVGRRDICESCLSDNYVQCAACEDYVRNGDAFLHDGHAYCESCYAETEPKLEYIKPYGSKPNKLIFHGLPDEKVPAEFYFGWELEVEHASFTASEQDATAGELAKIPWLWFTQDGSLTNGFEIKSHPLSWLFYKTNKDFIQKEILEYLSKNKYTSYDSETCGLHIHVSRKNITPLHHYKIQKFIFSNPEFILSISKRSEENLRAWASVYENIPWARVAKKTVGDLNRKLALNSRPANTIEFRLFRGSLKPSTFFRAFEFVHAVIYYTKKTSHREINFQGFLEYVKKNAKEYPNLFEFLVPALKKTEG